MTTNDQEDCKGCLFTDDCNYIKESDKCSCKQCIVKVVCTTVCDKYLEFTSKFIDLI